MNCHDAYRSFFALLDGQLALTERAPVEIHLRQCDPCQAELERLRRRPPLLRAVWRARCSLGWRFENISVPRLVAPTREFLFRCPPRVFPVAAAVTLLVVLVMYGFQRQAELAPTPAERPPAPSPMIEAPLPSPEPIAKREPSILPLAPDPTSPSPGHSGERITSSSTQAKPMARLHDARPRVARDAVVATARKPSAAWIIGRTKDEQIAPESEPVRRDRD